MLIFNEDGLLKIRESRIYLEKRYLPSTTPNRDEQTAKPKRDMENVNYGLIDFLELAQPDAAQTRPVHSLRSEPCTRDLRRQNDRVT